MAVTTDRTTDRADSNAGWLKGGRWFCLFLEQSLLPLNESKQLFQAGDALARLGWARQTEDN